jgi:hypothetical protein
MPSAIRTRPPGAASRPRDAGQSGDASALLECGMRPRIAILTDAQRALFARYETLYAEWRLADEAARAAEAAVLAAVAARHADGAASTTREQWETALRLRSVAERTLDRALEAVRSAPL